MRSFEASLADTLRTFQALAEIRPEIARTGEMILATFRRGGKLLICGNRGSAAEAAHFSTELVGCHAKDRRAVRNPAASSKFVFPARSRRPKTAAVPKIRARQSPHCEDAGG